MNESTPHSVRLGAIEGLASLNDPAGRAALEEIGRRKGSPAPGAAVVALATIDVDEAAEIAAAFLADADATGSRAHLRGLRRAEGRAGRPGARAAAQVDRGRRRQGRPPAHGTSGRPEPKLVEALTKAGKLDAARTMTAAERAALLADVASQGDPARGEAIFRREAMQCLKCHAIAGAGGQVGPGLECSAQAPRSTTSSTPCSTRPRPSRRTITRRSSPRATAGSSPA